MYQLGDKTCCILYFQSR